MGEFGWDGVFSGGEWGAPMDGGVRPSIDPSTGEAWGDVAYGGRADIDRAVAAAKAAFEGPWRRRPPWERAALLRQFADLYATHVDELGHAPCRGRVCQSVMSSVVPVSLKNNSYTSKTTSKHMYVS